MSRLRVGMLGCGGIAARHADAIAALNSEMELVACCGRDLPRTEQFAANHGGEAFVDLGVMLDTSGLDLVVATLPPFCRDGEIEAIAERGIHLLVEKPIALDLPSAEAMVAAVAKAGVTAAIGFMYRFGTAIEQWRATDTGPVGLYAGEYHCNALHASWWRDKAKSGGQILEQVIHQIDLIRHLVGEPDGVTARFANLFHCDVPGYDVEDVSAILFSWDDGRIATLNASNIATPGIWHKHWSIYARDLTGRFSSWNEAVFTPTVRDAEPMIVAYERDPFVAQLADLAEAIASERPPRTPLAEGAATLKLALAARRSAEERREIRLDDAL
jgi:predicted dehydrogenase